MDHHYRCSRSLSYLSDAPPLLPPLALLRQALLLEVDRAVQGRPRRQLPLQRLRRLFLLAWQMRPFMRPIPSDKHGRLAVAHAQVMRV